MAKEDLIRTDNYLVLTSPGNSSLLIYNRVFGSHGGEPQLGYIVHFKSNEDYSSFMEDLKEVDSEDNEGMRKGNIAVKSLLEKTTVRWGRGEVYKHLTGAEAKAKAAQRRLLKTLGGAKIEFDEDYED